MSLNTLIAQHRATIVAAEPTPAQEALEAVPMSAVLSGDTVAALEDLNTAVNDLGELSNVLTGMESILGSLESHKETPLTVREVEYLNLAVEGYVGKYGMTAVLVPSIESVGGIDGLVASTESRIGDMLNAAWKWIKETCVRIKALVIDFFERIFSEAKRLEVRGKKLHDKAKSTKGTRKNTYISLRALGDRMVLDGKVASPEDCLAAITKVLDLSGKWANELANMSLTAAKAGEKVASAQTAEAYTAAASEVHDAIRSYMQSVLAQGGFTMSDNKGLTSELPGGVVFAMDNVTGDVEAVQGGSKAPADAKLEVSTLTALASTGIRASKVGTMAHGLSKAGRTKINQWGFDKLAAPEPPEGAAADVLEAAKEAVKSIRESTSDIAKGWNGISKILRHCVQSGMASMAVAEKMLAQYAEEAPAK